MIASDAAADGRRKIEQVVHRRFGEAAPMPVIRFFASAELGLAMGRPNVIHAAVLQSPSGRSFVEAAIRFQRYESVADGPVPATADKPQDMMDE